MLWLLELVLVSAAELELGVLLELEVLPLGEEVELLEGVVELVLEGLLEAVLDGALEVVLGLLAGALLAAGLGAGFGALAPDEPPIFPVLNLLHPHP